ncbi:hypothetical protein BJ912DRAFT_950447, partial [Pholiota molesta]
MWVCPECSCWRRRRRAAACRRRGRNASRSRSSPAGGPKSDAAATEAAARITSADAAGVADLGCSAGAGACVGVQRLRGRGLFDDDNLQRGGGVVEHECGRGGEDDRGGARCMRCRARCTLGARVVHRRRAFRPPSCRPVHVVASLLSVDLRGRWQLSSPCWGDGGSCSAVPGSHKGRATASSRPLLPSPSSSIVSVHVRVCR